MQLSLRNAAGLSDRSISFAWLLVLLAVFVQQSAWASHPGDHAPIGVMGDHLHEAGEWMFSYRYMHMSMEGNQSGTSDVSAAEIVTSEPNVFGMPPTLRVVPTSMDMDMHMFGAMYAPSDRVTLMGMTNYVSREMDHTAFAGPAGDTVLGTFTTKTSGFGDLRLSALVGLLESNSASRVDRWHLNLGVSLPTGSIDETDDILTPMNTRPTVRLPYPMQLGSGTTDALLGVTYSALQGAWNWGGQWMSTLRTGENDEDYRLGDEHKLQGWLGYRVSQYLSLSARLSWTDRGNIDGRDPRIAAPVQTADPNRQGGDRLDLSLGANVVVPGTRQRLALELGAPLQQDLDGPQMQTDWQLTVGWQMALGGH